MKEFLTIAFIIFIVGSVIFEKISEFRKNLEKNKRMRQPSKGPHNNETAEEFFKRIKSKNNPHKELAPAQIQPIPTEPKQEPLLPKTSDTALKPSKPVKKQSAKKSTLNFKDKHSIKKAIIMKTILDSPQAYKH